MVPQNQLVTREAVATPRVGASYRTLLLRLWLVRARLSARAAVQKYRPLSTDDDRRLAATLAAGAMAFLTWLACLVVGFSATTYIVLVAVGFFATLGVGLVLLFGPDDYDCDAEFAEVTGLLPEAKRIWHEKRAEAQAARKQAQAARKRAKEARKQAGSKGVNISVHDAEMDETGIVDLVEPLPGGEPHSLPMGLEGDGSYAVPVLGEVHLARILADVCGNELPQVGQNKIVQAMVRIEKSNRALRSVSVEIAGRRVGHLSPTDAQALWKRLGGDSQPFECQAVIHGGWRAGRIHYELRLDINVGAAECLEASATH